MLRLPHQIIVVILGLIVGVIDKQVIYQVEGCIIESLDVTLNLSIMSDELILFYFSY